MILQIYTKGGVILHIEQYSNYMDVTNWL